MFAGAHCAGPGYSAKVARFESAVDTKVVEILFGAQAKSAGTRALTATK